MSRSAGTGSPVWFRCWIERRERTSRDEHRIELTGREKPQPHRRYHAAGTRSTRTLREYRCSCGHVGWSNHIDLARLAGAPREEWR